MYSINSESARHPDILSLIAALDRYQSELYPAESNHLIDLAALPETSLILMVIRDQQLQAVGCGAIVLNGDGTGEMKRVYIDPAHRGQHLGETLLAALEDEALSRHCHTVRLETGIKQRAGLPRSMKLTCAAMLRLPHRTLFSNTLTIRTLKLPSPRASWAS